jgi:hypothetical protein
MDPHGGRCKKIRLAVILQYGLLCKRCRGRPEYLSDACTACDPPRAEVPARIECLACDGLGCDDCEKRGYWELDRCPRELVTGDVWDVIEAADLFAKGLPPMAGGTRDQAAAFLTAARIVWAEEARWKAEAMK